MYRFILLTFCLMISSAIFSQGRYNGYVISNENDTIRGAIHLGNDALRTVRISFTDYEVQKAVELEPFQVKAYFANSQFYESKIYDIDDGLDYGYAVFMERLVAGGIQLYKYFNNQKGRFELIIEDEGKKMVLITPMNFRKKMVELFSEHQLLTAKIVRNVYELEDLPDIVRQYNEWKKGQVMENLTKKER